MREQTLGEEIIEGLTELVLVVTRGDRLSNHFEIRVAEKPKNERIGQCEK